MALERDAACDKDEEDGDGVEMLSLLQHEDDDDDNPENDPSGIKVSSNISALPSRKHTVAVAVICGAMGILLLVLISTRTGFASAGLFFHKHIRSSNTKSSCDCHHRAARCCDRTIFRTHKFGTILIGDMFQQYRQKDAIFHIHTSPTPKNIDYQLPTTLDYRHVLVTRNWFDAIVSGYLYHKAGYECTMDYKGNATDAVQKHSKFFDLEKNYHLKDWDTDLQLVQNSIPPRQNRSFCDYLAEETEEVGIQMVMDFALSKWYKGVVPYHDKALQREHQTGQQKSLFLCFEDLVDPFQQEGLFHEIAAFLFPGLNETSEWQLPGRMQASIQKQQATHGAYEGGHASNHDPTVRDRLRKLVVQYDQEIFGRRIETSSAIFGCG